jgi:ubiquinone/menaquinone biosynthesis C-methylase UbiE
VYRRLGSGSPPASFAALPDVAPVGSRVPALLRAGSLHRFGAESIRKHPDQATLKAMMEAAGFGHVEVRNLSGGIVAIHRAYKL